MGRVKAATERFTARQRCVVGGAFLVAWGVGIVVFPGVDLVLLYIASMLMFFSAVTVRINTRR
ncbi:hypothetical protein DMX05_08280 [Pseudomonas soli]|nr:hypothetical protein DMX05_08280 [Pseudomonas soli]